jgi:hypothetical protein
MLYTPTMRTPLSIQDLAVLTAALEMPVKKSSLACRALNLARGATFDETVAVATVDRLVALGALRKVAAHYEITREGRAALGQALQDYRQALEAMSRVRAPRLVDDPCSDARERLVTGVRLIEQDTLTG